MSAESLGDAVPEQQRKARLGGGAIASLVGLGLLIVFMIQNTEDVKVKFLAWDFTWPVWLLVLVSAVVGALVWFGLGVLRRHRRRKDRRVVTRRHAGVEDSFAQRPDLRARLTMCQLDPDPSSGS